MTQKVFYFLKVVVCLEVAQYFLDEFEGFRKILANYGFLTFSFEEEAAVFRVTFLLKEEGDDRLLLQVGLYFQLYND